MGYGDRRTCLGAARASRQKRALSPALVAKALESRRRYRPGASRAQRFPDPFIPVASPGITRVVLQISKGPRKQDERHLERQRIDGARSRGLCFSCRLFFPYTSSSKLRKAEGEEKAVRILSLGRRTRAPEKLARLDLVVSFLSDGP